MTKIILTCKCSECKGEGTNKKITLVTHNSRNFKDCEKCKGSGKTVMEFESVDNHESVLSETYSEINGKHRLIRHGWNYDVYDENKTSLRLNKSINPLFLEFIEEQECPECDGSGMEKVMIPQRQPKCKNCTDGKVEVVTFTGFFGDMKEYDKALIVRGMGIESKANTAREEFKANG